jgi:hypothetical protein
VIRLYLAERLKSLALTPWRGPAWVRSFTQAAAWRGIIDECRAGGAAT